MKRSQYLIFLFLLLNIKVSSQNKSVESFSDIRKVYEDMQTDDSRAMPFVRKYIRKAKNESDLPKLIQGYRDGRQFSVSFEDKIKYADSTIYASKRLGNNDEISKSHLSKGILYYFNKKSFKPALDEYLKAYEYSKFSKDEYHRHKVLYHLGIVKMHLGYFEDALKHFEECLIFYREKSEKNLHQNEIHNHRKAYYNSLHQLTVVNHYLGNLKKSDSLSNLGYRLTENKKEFELEHSYFMKCRGISKFNSKEFTQSEHFLQAALPGLLKRNDFTWSSVVYFYLGKIAELQNNTEQAVKNYNKVDSIFVKNKFILPEVAQSYKYLISSYRDKDLAKELYYTNQLLKTDSVISKDFSYLSSRIHKDYDRNSLVEEKQNLEQTGRNRLYFTAVFAAVFCIVIGFFIFRYRKDRIIEKQYRLLQEKLMKNSGEILNEPINEYRIKPRKTTLAPEIADEIEKKLEKFERDLGFTKAKLNQKMLAHNLKTNSHYLSTYINEYKEVNFTKYIASLRIAYITHLLNTDREYLKYKVEVLAKECGIKTRQNFSDLFYEYNGIRPADFIKKKKEELGII